MVSRYEMLDQSHKLAIKNSPKCKKAWQVYDSAAEKEIDAGIAYQSTYGRQSSFPKDVLKRLKSDFEKNQAKAHAAGIAFEKTVQDYWKTAKPKKTTRRAH